MCRFAKHDGCTAQTNPTQPNPRPDPNIDPNPNPDPNPSPNPNPNPNPSPNPTVWGTLEVGRGSVEFTCKSENLARTCN